MFIHSGMLTLKEDHAEQAGPAIADALVGFAGVIPGLEKVTVGLSAGVNPGTASLMFVLEFDDEASWRAYGEHPAHKALVHDHIAPALEAKTFFQTRQWRHGSK